MNRYKGDETSFGPKDFYTPLETFFLDKLILFPLLFQLDLDFKGSTITHVITSQLEKVRLVGTLLGKVVFHFPLFGL